MNFRLFYFRDVTVGPCPNCDTIGSLERRKSGNRFESILGKIIKRKGFHCRKCKWDGKIFLFKLSKKAPRVLLNYLILFIMIIAAYYLINIFIRRYFGG